MIHQEYNTTAPRLASWCLGSETREVTLQSCLMAINSMYQCKFQALRWDTLRLVSDETGYKTEIANKSWLRGKKKERGHLCPLQLLCRSFCCWVIYGLSRHRSSDWSNILVFEDENDEHCYTSNFFLMIDMRIASWIIAPVLSWVFDLFWWDEVQRT